MAKPYASGPLIEEEEPIMDKMEFLESLCSRYVGTNNRVAGSILTWTSKRLFFKNLIYEKKRHYDPDLMFEMMKSLWDDWNENVYEDDLWFGDNYSTEELCSEWNKEAYLLGLTNMHLELLVLDRKEKEGKLLLKMINFFIGDEIEIKVKHLKSSENITKYLNEVVVPNAPDNNVGGACLETLQMMAEVYNCFKDLKLDDATSEIELENFGWAFYVVGKGL